MVIPFLEDVWAEGVGRTKDKGGQRAAPGASAPLWLPLLPFTCPSPGWEPLETLMCGVGLGHELKSPKESPSNNPGT